MVWFGIIVRTSGEQTIHLLSILTEGSFSRGGADQNICPTAAKQEIMPSIFLPPARKGKRIMLWTFGCFLLGQFVLTVYLAGQMRELRDPLYGYRLRSLRQRLAKSPNAPLFLILGSSRIKHSICPADLAIESAGSEPQPIIYNFGINGMGFIRSLMYFRRLLADGIRPDILLLETWPPLWGQRGFCQESRLVTGFDDVAFRDLPLVCRYFFQEGDVMRFALRRAFLPLSCYRARFLKAAVRSLLPREQAEEMDRQVSDAWPADNDGWFLMPWEPASAEAKAHALQQGVIDIKPLLNSLRLDPRSDTALRELLAECRQRGIRVALILMPEHSLTRGWYSPQARALVQDYLSRLVREEQVAIVDSRDWVSDDEFADSCHMSQKGVPAFCRRLGREVVQPLLEGKPLPGRVLFGGRDAERGSKGF
jgi:hypothetical protein